MLILFDLERPHLAR